MVSVVLAVARIGWRSLLCFVWVWEIESSCLQYLWRCIDRRAMESCIHCLLPQRCCHFIGLCDRTKNNLGTTVSRSAISAFCLLLEQSYTYYFYFRQSSWNTTIPVISHFCSAGSSALAVTCYLSSGSDRLLCDFLSHNWSGYPWVCKNPQSLLKRTYYPTRLCLLD